MGEPDPASDSDVTVDATRRTHLANERTYLAWWRTGITAVLASLAVGRILPELADTDRVFSAVIGSGLAVLGIAAMTYGWMRWRAVDRGLAAGRFEAPGAGVMLALSAGGAVLAVLTLVLVLDVL